MIELNNLGLHRKARLWLDNSFQELIFEPRKTIKQDIKLQATRMTGDANIAFELSLPGNASYYALLGMEFRPTESGDLLTINVNINDN